MANTSKENPLTHPSMALRKDSGRPHPTGTPAINEGNTPCKNPN